MAAKPRFDGEWVRLGELISKASIERCGDRKYPVYSMTMHDGIVEQAGRFKKTIASKDTSSYKVVKKNQLVVGFPIDEGVIYVQNHDAPGIMSPAYNVWDFDCKRIDPAYLELALHGPRSMAYYADKMRGTTARRRTLTADGLCNLEIPLPSIDDQIRAVHILDVVRSLIKGANRQIAELDALVKSRFVEMFGLINENPRRWETAALEDVAPICYQPVPQNGMVWQLNLDAVEAESGTVVSKCQVDAGELKGSIGGFAGSQVLYSKLRPYLNKVVLPDCPGVCTTELLPLTPDLDRIDRVYLASSLRSSEFVAFASSHSNGAKMPRVDMKAFKKFEIPVPPIERQQEFASFVAEVDKSRFIVQQQIEKLQMLYDSLAQEYFS